MSSEKSKLKAPGRGRRAKKPQPPSPGMGRYLFYMTTQTHEYLKARAWEKKMSMSAYVESLIK